MVGNGKNKVRDATLRETRMETCKICGRTIGRLETPGIWNNHVVCQNCSVILSKPPGAVSPMLPSTLAESIEPVYVPVSQREPVMLAYRSPHSPRPARVFPKGEVIICPNGNCGYHGPSLREACGSRFAAILLLLCGGVPGLVYIFLTAGWNVMCPRCRAKIRRIFR